MKYLFWFLVIFNLAIFSSAPAQKQRDYCLGSSYAAPVDTANTAKGDTIMGNVIIWKGPKLGSATLSGYSRKLSGSDTSLTVWIRQVTDNTVTPREYSPWDSLGVIAESDSIPFMFILSRQSWWGENDGFQPMFIIADTTGGRAYQVAAKSVSR